jgi:flagellar biosynthesis/type III secretory pathway M-ring protein FliF/YscJ
MRDAQLANQRSARLRRIFIAGALALVVVLAVVIVVWLAQQS